WSGRRDRTAPSPPRPPAPARARPGAAARPRVAPAATPPREAWWRSRPATTGRRRCRRGAGSWRVLHRQRAGAFERASQRAVVWIQLQGFAEIAPGLLALAPGPQHLGHVRGDLRVLLQRVRAPQLHQSLVVAPQPVEDPAVAVDDRR